MYNEQLLCRLCRHYAHSGSRLRRQIINYQLSSQLLISGVAALKFVRKAHTLIVHCSLLIVHCTLCIKNSAPHIPVKCGYFFFQVSSYCCVLLSAFSAFISFLLFISTFFMFSSISLVKGRLCDIGFITNPFIEGTCSTSVARSPKRIFTLW